VKWFELREQSRVSSKRAERVKTQEILIDNCIVSLVYAQRPPVAVRGGARGLAIILHADACKLASEHLGPSPAADDDDS
jgi:hypothetical protein